LTLTISGYILSFLEAGLCLIYGESLAMMPLFTIHAGEYLVGFYIENNFRNRFNVWIPSKDTGIDLLVTDRDNRRTASLQVKFGKDFLPGKAAYLQEPIRCISWFTIKRENLRQSRADFWVLVLRGFKRHSPDFVTVPTAEYHERLKRIHGLKGRGVIQSYLWVTERNQCWEARGLREGTKDERRIAAGVYENPVRDFTKYLNENGWAVLMKKLAR
jgi:hypothetical protein